MAEMKCCICEKKENGKYGNSPWPVDNAPDSRCCDECNFTVVLPARIAMMSKDAKKKGEK